MSLFRTVTLQRIRFGGGKYVDGSWIDGAPSETTFKGTFQPENGQMQELLPEGKRNRKTFIAYIPKNIDVRTADPRNTLEPDYIAYNGSLFEVIIVRAWNNKLIPHYEAVCVEAYERMNVDIWNYEPDVVRLGDSITVSGTTSNGGIISARIFSSTGEKKVTLITTTSNYEFSILIDVSDGFRGNQNLSIEISFNGATAIKENAIYIEGENEKSN